MPNSQIEYTGTDTASTSEIKEIDFDSCGKLSNYKDYVWFNDLNQAFQSEGYSGDIYSELGGEGCLSLNGNLYIFIPYINEMSPCMQIYSYDITNAILKTPDQTEYCANKFQKRVENYILFSGIIGDGGSYTCYNGEYYYEENRIDATTSTGDCQ
jgi:hypothetical protein